MTEENEANMATKESWMIREKVESTGELLRYFLRVHHFFFTYIEPRAREGKVDFPRLHEFMETEMFSFKEACHLLFRRNDHEVPSQASTGSLFDILIGSIFHEMLKIKENIYHLEVYAPLVERLEKHVNHDNIPTYERDFFRAYERIAKRARNSLRDDLMSVTEIFREASDNLKVLLRENRSYPLLSRMLVEDEDLVNEAYGDHGLEQVLTYMFEGDLAEGYASAASAFLKGGWYDKADTFANTALHVDPNNVLAQDVQHQVEQARKTLQQSK